jgi:molecular chaperone GrpE
MTNSSDSTDNNQSSVNPDESAEQALSDAVEAALQPDPINDLTLDLQRLQADFANYRKRVDRERTETTDVVTAMVVAQFLGALDDVDRAAAHGELTGGFKAVADQLINTTTKLGLTKFEQTHVEFDPNIHEALMHETSSEVTETLVTKVLRPGYKFKERVIRPAQVIVTDPAESESAETAGSN